MTRYSTLLPIVMWAAGLPLDAHALQAVDLAGDGGAVVGASAIATEWNAAADTFPSLCQPGAAAAPRSAWPTLVRTAEFERGLSRGGEAAEATGYLAEARLPVPGGDAERGGLFAQVMAGLAVIGLVARRRLGLL